MKHLSAVPEPPSARRPDVPRDLDLIVMRALAKDPADRYQSAEEMDADLERVRARRGGVARRRRSRRRRSCALPAEPYAATAATMISPGAAHGAAAASAAARLLRPRGADPPAADVAVGRRAALRARRGHRRLVPLQRDLEQAELDEAGRGRALPEHAGGAGARRRSRPTASSPVVDHHSSRTTPRGLVFKQDPTAGDAHAEGQPGAHLGLDGPAEGRACPTSSASSRPTRSPR